MSKGTTSERTIDNPKVVSREEWIAARKELLAKEKNLTRQRDAVSAERRQLPWVKVDKEYVFDAPGGKKTLADLFEGRSQLIVYHFMFGPDWKEGCPSCSFNMDHTDAALVHLAQRDDVRGYFAGDIATDRSVQEAHGMALCVGVVERQRLQPGLSCVVHQGRKGERQGVLQL
jgi:hypothetical protein